MHRRGDAQVPVHGIEQAAIYFEAWWILKTLQSAKWAGLGFLALGPSLLPLGAATLAATHFASMVGSWLCNKVGSSSHNLAATEGDGPEER